MLIGYARVSTADQNLDRQIDQLIEKGVDKRNIYHEKVTGTKKDRPALNKMLDELQEGDVVLITDLTRISRNAPDLLAIFDKIKEKGAAIKSIKETWLDTSSENPYNHFLLTVMAGLSQLERDWISTRTKEGLQSARIRGRIGGRPKIRNEKADLVLMMLDNGYKVKDIVAQTGLSRTSVYRIKNDNEKEGDKT